MAMQLEDVLDLERENETLRDALYLVRAELRRILQEYLEGLSLGKRGVDELEEEVETILSSVDSVLQ